MHKLIYTSSYDRGLEHCLRMWPDIRKEFHDAEFHVFYGWNTFDSVYADNPERQVWKQKMNKLMEQDGIMHHGRVSQEELKKWLKECTIFFYPTHFCETFCISVVDAQYQGCVPVVMSLAALKETVGAGVKVEGDIYFDDDFEKYKNELIALMKDQKRWEEEQAKGIEFAKSFSWDVIAKKWINEFQ